MQSQKSRPPRVRSLMVKWTQTGLTGWVPRYGMRGTPKIGSPRSKATGLRQAAAWCLARGQDGVTVPC